MCLPEVKGAFFKKYVILLDFYVIWDTDFFPPSEVGLVSLHWEEKN